MVIVNAVRVAPRHAPHPTAQVNTCSEPSSRSTDRTPHALSPDPPMPRRGWSRYSLPFPAEQWWRNADDEAGLTRGRAKFAVFDLVVLPNGADTDRDRARHRPAGIPARAVRHAVRALA
jgi:hypothetical protein